MSFNAAEGDCLVVERHAHLRWIQVELAEVGIRKLLPGAGIDDVDQAVHLRALGLRSQRRNDSPRAVEFFPV